MFKMIANMLDVNHSVLSGAMDIVVVKRSDGTFASSPFHIRFGTLKILKAREKIVDVYINNEKTPLTMKLSSSGDAYFSISQKNDIVTESSQNNMKEPQAKINDNLNNSADSPVVSKKSAPNTPSRLSKQFEKINLEELSLEELKENEQSTEKHEPRSFQVNTNNLSPKNSFSQFQFSPNQDSCKIHLKCVEMSLCYNELLKTPQNAEEIFLSKMIKKEDFYKDPWKFLNNSNLLICFDDKLYTYKTAMPLLLALLTYGEDLPQQTLEQLSLNGGLFGYFKSNKLQNKLNTIKVHNENNDSPCDVTAQIPKAKDSFTKRESFAKSKRSFSPSSDQIKLLNLKEGRNEIKFVCQSRLSGVQSLTADIYLWDDKSKIVISDIDGTITRSDVLGHIMPMIGKDWSHEGVTDLFTNIDKHGYKILYLTARAICQASATKNYIQTLFQNECCLPRGPVLMSPDGLISSFKREIIDKTPQTFKIACLTEIKNLFPEDYSPFYSGFGNRTTDAVSYRSVGIELSRIFIINEQGEVIQLNNSYKKTYTLINQIVGELFPVIEK